MVGLAALNVVKTINEIGQECVVRQVQIGPWAETIHEQAKRLFEGKRG